jgi:hypothetical protein
VKIIIDMGAGQSLMLLRELCQRDRQGRFVRLSAESLAASIDALGGVGTVTGCVRAIRRNVINRLGKHYHVACRADDLIRSDEQGYYLREWITFRDASAAAHKHVSPGRDSLALPGRSSDEGEACAADATGVVASEAGRANLNERQAWILAQLRRGLQLRRTDFEWQFKVHARTAKRDLAELNQRGLIAFVGEGRDGNYVLRGSGGG